jgi:hypothetical protein
MLSLAQGSDREMVMDNSGKERGEVAAEFISYIT